MSSHSPSACRQVIDLLADADAVSMFCTDRHLATFTTMRADGSAHVSPVGFTWDGSTRSARIIASAGTQKVRNIERNPRVVICQVDGGRWLSLEGVARVTTDPDEVLDAMARYAVRYQEPRPNPNRIAIIITVERALGRL